MPRWFPIVTLTILLAIPACRRNTTESDALGVSEGSAEMEKTESAVTSEAVPEGSADMPEDPHAGADEWSEDTERLGTFYVGMLRSALREELLDPPERSDRALDDSTGLYMETWGYPRRGLTFVFESPNESGDMLLRSIQLAGSSPLRTSRQVGIGTAREQVLEAYADAPILLREDAVVVGTEQSGVRFDLTEMRVSSIFIGPNP